MKALDRNLQRLVGRGNLQVKGQLEALNTEIGSVQGQHVPVGVKGKVGRIREP